MKLSYVVFGDSLGVNIPTMVISSYQHDATDYRVTEMCTSTSLYSISTIQIQET